MVHRSYFSYPHIIRGAPFELKSRVCCCVHVLHELPFSALSTDSHRRGGRPRAHGRQRSRDSCSSKNKENEKTEQPFANSTPFCFRHSVIAYEFPTQILVTGTCNHRCTVCTRESATCSRRRIRLYILLYKVCVWSHETRVPYIVRDYICFFFPVYVSLFITRACRWLFAKTSYTTYILWSSIRKRFKAARKLILVIACVRSGCIGGRNHTNYCRQVTIIYLFVLAKLQWFSSSTLDTPPSHQTRFYRLIY